MQPGQAASRNEDYANREIERLIASGLDVTRVEVRSDDNTHYAALVVAAEFAGVRPLQRHQMIYRCLGERVGNDIHALSITALTPAEWQARQG